MIKDRLDAQEFGMQVTATAVMHCSVETLAMCLEQDLLKPQ
jgi:hypothetical protein